MTVVCCWVVVSVYMYACIDIQQSTCVLMFNTYVNALPNFLELMMTLNLALHICHHVYFVFQFQHAKEDCHKGFFDFVECLCISIICQLMSFSVKCIGLVILYFPHYIQYEHVRCFLEYICISFSLFGAAHAVNGGYIMA